MDNSQFKFDTSSAAENMNYTKMSDCGRLSTKLRLLAEIVSKSLYSSLKAFRAAVLSAKPASGSKAELSLTSNSRYTIVQIISQNLRTDYRIHILGHLAGGEDPAKLVDTLAFICRFRNAVGGLLAEQDGQRRAEEAAKVSLGTMLADLKDDVTISRNSIKETVTTAEQCDTMGKKKKQQQLDNKAEIPGELMKKLVELVRADGEPLPEEGKEGCLSGVFTKEDKALLENIKKSNRQLVSHIRMLSRDEHQTGKRTPRLRAGGCPQVKTKAKSREAMHANPKAVSELGRTILLRSVEVVKKGFECAAATLASVNVSPPGVHIKLHRGLRHAVLQGADNTAPGFIRWVTAVLTQSRWCSRTARRHIDGPPKTVPEDGDRLLRFHDRCMCRSRLNERKLLTC